MFAARRMAGPRRTGSGPRRRTRSGPRAQAEVRASARDRARRLHGAPRAARRGACRGAASTPRAADFTPHRRRRESRRPCWVIPATRLRGARQSTQPRENEMALNEYKPGTAFPGVIGRTTDESSPAWPQPVRAVPGAPNVLFIVLDDTGFGQLGCYGSPIATPNIDALAAGGLRYTNMHTTALCSPSRSCIITGRNHHANAMAASPSWPTGYPGYNGHIPFENGFLSEMLLQHGYNTYMVGKWHLIAVRAGVRGRPVRPLAAGPRLRALLRLPRRRHQPVVPRPGLRQPPGRAAAHARGGLPPDRGPGRQGDRVHRRRQAGRARTSRSTCTSAPGATHAPHHVPKEWADRYKGQFDDGWDAYRERVFARQKELGHRARRTPSSRATTPTCRSGTRSRRTQRRLVRADDGGLRRLPVAHRPPHRPAARLPARRSASSTTRSIMVVSDNGASAEGGVDRHDQRDAVLQQRPGAAGGQPRRRSTSSAARRPSTTTRGAGPGRATRRSAAGSARPTAAARATRSSSTGRRASRPRRGAHAVRARHRHGADRARRAGHRAAGQRSEASRSHRSRASASPTPSTTPTRADAPPHPVLRDVRPPRDRPRRLARGLPLAGPVLRRGRQALRHADHGRDAGRARRQRLGALPRRRGPRREPRRRRRAPGQADRDDRACGTSRPASTTCCPIDGSACSG